MSLQRCQIETTSTEFLDWIEYLEQDVNAFHREDWFLANIAREIRRTILKNPNKSLGWEEFLLKFSDQKEMEEKGKDKEKAMAKLKGTLLAGAGIGKKK